MGSIVLTEKILAPIQNFSLDGTIQLDIGMLSVFGSGPAVILGLFLVPQVIRSITSQVLPDKFKLIQGLLSID